MATALERLAKWGNLRADPDTSRVTALEDFYRARHIYQLTRAGEAAEEALARYDEALGRRGELQAVALADIAVQLRALLALAERPEPDPGCGAPVAAGVGGPLLRTGGERPGVHGLAAAHGRPARGRGRGVPRLQAAADRVPGTVHRGPGHPGSRDRRPAGGAGHLRGGSGRTAAAARRRARGRRRGPRRSRRGPGRRRAPVGGPLGGASRLVPECAGTQLPGEAAAFGGPPGDPPTAGRRPGVERATGRALGPLRRLPGTGPLVRRGARRRLPPPAVAVLVRTVLRAPSDHRPGGLDEREAGPVPPSASWYDAPGVRISPQLRRTGSYERRGRARAVQDRSEAKAYLVEVARKQAEQTAAARARLATRGEVTLSDLDELDRDALRLFLLLLGDALAKWRPGTESVATTTNDGTMEIRLTRVPGGGVAEIRTLDGILRGPEHLVEIVDLTAEYAPAGAARE